LSSMLNTINHQLRSRLPRWGGEDQTLLASRELE
jgi:hypothetical protein